MPRTDSYTVCDHSMCPYRMKIELDDHVCCGGHECEEPL